MSTWRQGNRESDRGRRWIEREKWTEQMKLGHSAQKPPGYDRMPCSGVLNGFPDVQTSRRKGARLISFILPSPFPLLLPLLPFSSFYFFPLLWIVLLIRCTVLSHMIHPSKSIYIHGVASNNDIFNTFMITRSKWSDVQKFSVDLSSLHCTLGEDIAIKKDRLEFLRLFVGLSEGSIGISEAHSTTKYL